ncbi:hypothetical protein X772_22175 [Mesorhizobium sp. LSJC280B00]|nr:hypothetical protein X772_22175 [Mesorhizobium sp. LSJC280B00]
MERRKKSKMSNPHQIAFYGKGPSAKPPLPNSALALSTLAQEILAGGESKAHHTDFILTSHLAARCA